MTDRPMLMNAAMVRATLREIEAPGTGKRQHRVPIRGPWRGRPWPEFRGPSGCMSDPECWGWQCGETGDHIGIVPSSNGGYSQHVQQWRVGDRAWVRETHYVWSAGYLDGRGRLIHYRADTPDAPCTWTPSIHMPRWASRLTLLIEDVRVQRLQDISEEDARAEGVEPPETEREDHDWSICPKCGGTGLHGALGDRLGYMEVDCSDCATARNRFMHLWNGIYGEGAFEANPWIVALSYKPILTNIDSLKEAA